MNKKSIFIWLMACVATLFSAIPSALHAQDPYAALETHEITDSGTGETGSISSATAESPSVSSQLSQTLTTLETLIDEYKKLIAKLESQLGQSGSTDTASSGDVDINSRLNVRATPWGTIIGKLSHGDKVLIAAKEGDWFKIRLGDGYGYVHSYYIDAPGYTSATQITGPSQTPSETPTQPIAQTPPVSDDDQEPSEQVEFGYEGTSIGAYKSATLKIDVEKFQYSSASCWVSKIWVANPSRQFTKCGSVWKKNLQRPATLAKQNDKIVLAVNCSGFYSSSFSNANHAYGSDPETYNTTGGSIVITNGKTLRNVSSVPFTGIAISPEGLNAYYEVPTSKVVDVKAFNTFAFEHHNDREKFLYRNGKTCKFTMAGISARTVIVKVDQNNFYIITVKGASGKAGLKADQLKTLIAKFGPCQWAFNADGGGSTALLFKSSSEKSLGTIYGGSRSVGDIFAVTE